ncbi:MAG TPA: hypothetical protein DCS43_03590 [Verrucomicrobia bacterium]|nr:hypothetical protein [Verrucomicrobiota bacterium]
MEELIEIFNLHAIRYLVIGGQAVRLEGFPRFSMDWDVLLPPHDTNNIARINALIEDELDYPLEPLGPRSENFIQTYQTRWGILQFHLGAPGLSTFDVLESRAVHRPLSEGIVAKCICGSDLLASKRATHRAADIADIEFLEAKQQAGLL